MSLQQTAPTKGNLMSTKKSLDLSKVGFELMDKKRNILIREMMALIDRATNIQGKINDAYKVAYESLQRANVTLGFSGYISHTIPEEQSLKLDYKSIMGVEIPILSIDTSHRAELHYGLHSTNSLLDETRIRFTEVKMLTAELAEVENSVYRLADAINKTQKRANALKNILIPRFESDIKFISAALDEKEREEFSRLKVIKQKKEYEKAKAEKDEEDFV